MLLSARVCLDLVLKTKLSQEEGRHKGCAVARAICSKAHYPHFRWDMQSLDSKEILLLGMTGGIFESVCVHVHVCTRVGQRTA